MWKANMSLTCPDGDHSDPLPLTVWWCQMLKLSAVGNITICTAMPWIREVFQMMLFPFSHCHRSASCLKHFCSSNHFSALYCDCFVFSHRDTLEDLSIVFSTLVFRMKIINAHNVSKCRIWGATWEVPRGRKGLPEVMSLEVPVERDGPVAGVQEPLYQYPPVMPCGWGVKTGMVQVWLADKTVWSLANTGHIWAL